MAKSNCNKCIHCKMCKYNGITSEELLKDLKENLDRGSRSESEDKYDFIEDVEFTCKYFEKTGGVVEKAIESKPKKTTETVSGIKQTVITEDEVTKIPFRIKTEKIQSKDRGSRSESKDEKFGALSVFTMGFDSPTEKEFLKLGIGTMNDVYAMSYKISEESKAKINAKLEVFNQKKI